MPYSVLYMPAVRSVGVISLDHALTVRMGLIALTDAVFHAAGYPSLAFSPRVRYDDLRFITLLDALFRDKTKHSTLGSFSSTNNSWERVNFCFFDIFHFKLFHSAQKDLCLRLMKLTSDLTKTHPIISQKISAH